MKIIRLSGALKHFHRFLTTSSSVSVEYSSSVGSGAVAIASAPGDKRLPRCRDGAPDKCVCGRRGDSGWALRDSDSLFRNLRRSGGSCLGV